MLLMQNSEDASVWLQGSSAGPQHDCAGAGDQLTLVSDA